VTIYQLAEQIIRLASSGSPLVLQPIDRTDVELRIPNIDKAKKLLGFEPRVNLEEGLLRTIYWYRSQLTGR
jgi:nucleoside-diphosphate-sugar epimerase